MTRDYKLISRDLLDVLRQYYTAQAYTWHLPDGKPFRIVIARARKQKNAYDEISPLEYKEVCAMDYNEEADAFEIVSLDRRCKKLTQTMGVKIGDLYRLAPRVEDMQL